MSGIPRPPSFRATTARSAPKWIARGMVWSMPDVDHWVFGYGSLVDPQSAAETIGRIPPMIPSVLPGWRRRWNGLTDNRVERRYLCLDCGGAPAWVVCLNCEPDAGSECSGVLVGVTDAELAALDDRERRYDRTRVGADAFVPPAPADTPVWIYERKPELVLDRLPPGERAVLPSAYLALVEKAIADPGLVEVPIAPTRLIYGGTPGTAVCRCAAPTARARPCRRSGAPG